MSRNTPKLGSVTDLPRLMYSRRELAEILGVSVRQVKNWTLAGRIKALRPTGDDNGPAFYSADEVRRILKAWQS